MKLIGAGFRQTWNRRAGDGMGRSLRNLGATTPFSLRGTNSFAPTGKLRIELRSAAIVQEAAEQRIFCPLAIHRHRYLHNARLWIASP
jgi:hypothetical protein